MSIFRIIVLGCLLPASAFAAPVCEDQNALAVVGAQPNLRLTLPSFTVGEKEQYWGEPTLNPLVFKNDSMKCNAVVANERPAKVKEFVKKYMEDYFRSLEGSKANADLLESFRAEFKFYNENGRTSYSKVGRRFSPKVQEAFDKADIAIPKQLSIPATTGSPVSEVSVADREYGDGTLSLKVQATPDSALRELHCTLTRAPSGVKASEFAAQLVGFLDGIKIEKAGACPGPEQTPTKREFCPNSDLGPALGSISGSIDTAATPIQFGSAAEISQNLTDTEKLHCYIVPRVKIPQNGAVMSSSNLHTWGGVLKNDATRYQPAVREWIDFPTPYSYSSEKVQCKIKEISRVEGRVKFPQVTVEEFRKATEGWFKTNISGLYAPSCGKPVQIGKNQGPAAPVTVNARSESKGSALDAL